MDCGSTATFSFLINGRREGKVVPTRGLRQGCPLSPYLFLLCAEGFSPLLKKAQNDRMLMGVSCSRGAPALRLIICYSLMIVLFSVTRTRG